MSTFSLPITGARALRCGDWIRLSAHNHANEVALYGPDSKLTYAELNSRTNRAATALRATGVVKGDRVALFATDSHQYVEVLFACMKLGAVFVPMNFRLNAAELRVLLESCDAKVLFFSARYSKLVEGLTPELVRFDGPGEVGTDYEQWLDVGTDEEIDVRVDDGDLACIAYTSGTTGMPKGVMHSQLMVKHYVHSTILERRLPEESFHYSAAPVFHISGMYFTIAQLVRGDAALLLPDFDPDTVLRWLAPGGVTDCFLVPTMVSTLLRHPGVRTVDYSNLRSIAYGGSPMSVELLREAMSVFGCEFLQPFGAGTEAGIQTVLTADDHRRALAGHPHLLGSIGRPAIGVDLRLCDDDLADVPPGEIGEIVTRSAAMMSGYLDQPEKTAQVLVDGWYRGGDMAYADDEGYLYLVGRKDDMIIRGGENVYPAEIEAVLATLPGVLEVAVVGVPDRHWGQIVRAHIVLADGAMFDQNAAVRTCRDRLAAYKVPAEFQIDASLPKNTTGKVQKFLLAGKQMDV